MIDDVIIISALISAVAFLFFSTKKQRASGNTDQYFMEKWSPEIKAVVTEAPKQSTPQARWIISNLRQKLQMLFPPPYMFRKKFTGMLSVLNDRDIMSEIKIAEGPKSFTINKKNIYLCLKDKKADEENYYDYNSLIYVTLHEVAHVLCDELGHTKKFQMIFKELLNHAASLALYNENKPFIKNYCPT